MSRAFVKEQEDGGVEDLPDRLISEHPNLVTPEGLKHIEAEVARLMAEHSAAQSEEDRTRTAAAARDLRYWTARQQSAEVVTPPADPEHVHFGSTVMVARARWPAPDVPHRRRGRGRSGEGHHSLRVAAGTRAGRQGRW